MKLRTWIAWASLSPALALGCGGLLEVDDLTFDQDAGVGGTAGASSGGSAGNHAGGSAGSTGGSAGSTAGSAGSGGSSGASNCQIGAEFDAQSDLDCFFRDQPQGTGLSITGGQLVVEPIVAPWFEQAEGFFLYRDIGSDNFAAATRVAVTSISSPPAAPVAAFAGGGLALRLAGDQANNALLSFSTFEGNSMRGGPYGHWTLNNGTQATPAWTEASVYTGWLGLCRAGSTLNLYYRTDQSGLTLLASITQGEYVPDITSLNELGLTAHAYDGAPDTRVTFKWFRIARGVPAVIGNCATQVNGLIAAGN